MTDYLTSGDEPLMDAQLINLQWGKTWPKVIARAWYIERRKEQGEPISRQDQEWFDKLLSGTKQGVREALEAEGFAPSFKRLKKVNDKNGIGEHDFEWFWKFTNIFVKRAEDGAEIVKRVPENTVIKIVDTDDPNNTQYEYQGEGSATGLNPSQHKNGWYNDTRIAHTLILTLPPMPAKSDHIALAVTDYEAKGLVYPFSLCCC